MQDLGSIQELLRPLEERGVLVRRSEEQLLSELPHFTVLERESKVLGCAAMKPLGRNAEGDEVRGGVAGCMAGRSRARGTARCRCCWAWRPSSWASGRGLPVLSVHHATASQPPTPRPTALTGG